MTKEQTNLTGKPSIDRPWLKYYPEQLCTRYKLGEPSEVFGFTDAELLDFIGRKRGFRISGGEIDLERTVSVLLDEFRSGKIGRITLDHLSADKLAEQ